MIITAKDIKMCRRDNNCAGCDYDPTINPFYDNIDWSKTVCYAMYILDKHGEQSPHHTIFIS